MVFPNLNFLKISSEKTGSACRNGECFLFFVRKEFEVVKTTEMEIKSMMERPIPKKKIGIIRLKVEKEQKSLWGMKDRKSVV